MKGGANLTVGRSQLRWVILLLVIAVVLPTIGLLWFINQAVKNERLAVRQKLVAVYQDKLDSATQKTTDTWAKNLDFLTGLRADVHPYQTFVSLVTVHKYDGLIIYDAKGPLIYPASFEGSSNAEEMAEVFDKAWQYEFAEQKFDEAARLYDGAIGSNNNYAHLTALIGKSRCLAKLGRLDEAIDQCTKAAFSRLEKQQDVQTLVLIGNARLLLLSFLRQNKQYTDLFEETFKKLLSGLYITDETGPVLPANHNVFLAQKALELLRENPSLKDKLQLDVEKLEKLVAAEQLSIDITRHFPTAQSLITLQEDKFQRLGVGEEVAYCLYHKSGKNIYLLLLSQENICSAFTDYQKAFAESDSVCRIIDGSGRFVAGVAEVQGQPFAAGYIGRYFPGWKIELYFKAGDIFEKAAGRQVAVYTWTGALVILLILGAGGFAAQAVNRQIKLNRMKNDFIATVSHELKTPLASMRVLVDTILEGNYKNQEQAEEYLKLTSKENERLSRMIDNFLTFSRMERNKKAFDIMQTDPVSIVHDAAEAVTTKLRAGSCEFSVEINANLPDIQADHDAIVTVLINLLDNAYKYSYDDKKISIRVFAEQNHVCFQVIDNGIGMSRRAAKRIFNKFYQVDRSLSRRAEGCGLGLSIVKFIVDAHKGSISVESKPDKGSTFTVKLPIANRVVNGGLTQ